MRKLNRRDSGLGRRVELEPLLDLVGRLSDVVNDLADEPLTLRAYLSRWDVWGFRISRYDCDFFGVPKRRESPTSFGSGDVQKLVLESVRFIELEDPLNSMEKVLVNFLAEPFGSRMGSASGRITGMHTT